MDNCPALLRRFCNTTRSRFSIMYYNRYTYNSEKNIAYRINPKAACTSFNACLCEINNKNVLKVHQESDRFKVDSYRMNKDVFTFTYVRNPYDKLCSCFSNLKLEDHGVNDTLNIGINDYLRRCKNFKTFIYKVFFTPKFMLDIHLLPQSYILKYDLDDINFIGKIENVADTFQQIQQRFGLNALPHYNESYLATEKLVLNYTRFQKFLVYLKYRKDFKIFGYKN